MCDRISWIELPDKSLLYLTTYDLWDTPQGKAVREQFCTHDWWGHAAIKYYYEQRLREHCGTEHECTDYSKPSNFPDEIAQAIKDGKFRDIADPRMLSNAARVKCASYDKAWAAYDKAWAAWDKAWAAYDKAWAAWDKALAACDKARAACDKARAACDKARASCDKAWAAWDKAWGESSDPFPFFWKLFANKRNRAKAWK